MSITHQLTYFTLKLFYRWLGRLSNRERIRVGERIGTLVFHRLKVRQNEARLNLQIAFPDSSLQFRETTLRQLHRHFGVMFLDALCPKALLTNSQITVKGEEKIASGYSTNRGVILMVGHFGNWELIPPWLSARGYEMMTIAQRQSNRGADLFFTQNRQKSGSSPISTSTAPSVMIEALREGKILILASDQNAGKRGEFVHFFGRPASSPRGPSFFHKKTGAAVITAFCHRKPTGNYELKFNRLPDDGAGTVMERFTSVLESEVRKRPAQYFWFHRRWKSFPKK